MTPISLSPQAGRAHAATWVMFFVSGSVIGTWAASVPFVRSEIGISTEILGICLLAFGVGTVGMNLPVGHLLHRYPSAGMSRIGALLVPVAGILPLLARTAVELALALAVMGVSFAVLDVSMNAHGVAIEKKLGAVIMSSLHGGWSVGGLLGAGCVALGHVVGIPPRLEVAIYFAFLLAIGSTFGRQLGDATIASEDFGRAGRGLVDVLPSRTVLLIGLLLMALFSGEGTVNDWSALYVTEGLGGTGALGAAGVATFAAGMALGRFFGDWLNRRVGPRSLLTWGAITATVALGLLVGVGEPAFVAPALLLVGLGLANGAPLLISAAGNAEDMTSAAAVAAASMMANAGLLVAPPLFGLVAQRSSLGVVILIAAGLIGLVALAVRKLSFPGS
jgi:predicted MFS family arabinose efflux permease